MIKISSNYYTLTNINTKYKMTLLGKLFRPWDPTDEQHGSSIDCDDRNDTSAMKMKSLVSRKDGELFKNTHNAANGKCASQESGGAVKVHQNSHRKAKVIKDAASKHSRAQIKSEESLSGGIEMHSAGPHLSAPDLYSNIPGCCEPNSPSEFDLYCSGNFLYPNPNTLNELASLSRHELTAMGLLPPEPASSLKIRRQRPKRFQCPHCQVAFSNNGQLRGHIRIHTGERPFVCEDEGCGKSFTRNEELTRHRRIHSGLRPFPCSYCGKKFGRKDHLKKHTRTHQRGVYNPRSAFVIGYGNPFQQFHQNLLSSTPFATPNDLITLQSQYSSFSQQSQPLVSSTNTTTTSSSSTSSLASNAAAAASASFSSTGNGNGNVNGNGTTEPLLVSNNNSSYPHPHHNNPWLYHAMNFL